MRKCFFLLVVTIQIVCLVGSAYAQNVAPCADEVFANAYINLTSGKAASFTALTYNTCNKIEITSSYLQQKIEGEWVTIASFSVAGAGINTYACTLREDCSGLIASGTYRVVGTFSADGHTVTRTSNERTY